MRYMISALSFPYAGGLFAAETLVQGCNGTLPPVNQTWPDLLCVILVCVSLQH